MNKNDNLNDRFMEELLREDARGRGAEEELLAAVEAAMEDEEESGTVTPLRRERSRAAYAWAAALTVSAASVLGYLGWRASEGTGALAGAPMRAVLEPLPGEQGVIVDEAGRAASALRIAPGEGRRSKLDALDLHVAAPTYADVAMEALEAEAPVPADGLLPGVAPMPAAPASPEGVIVGGASKQSPGKVPPSEPAAEGRKTDKSRPPMLGDMPEGLVDGVEILPEPPLTAGIADTEEVRYRPERSTAGREKGGEAPGSALAKNIAGKPAAGSSRGSNQEGALFGRRLEEQPGGDQGGFGEQAPPTDRERYGQLVDQPWKTPQLAKFSTFSVDVDTASYTNVRRMLQQGVAISPDAVRIEECINYFDYQYPAPTKGGPFAVLVDVATCPWAADHHLVKIGLKGMEVPEHQRPTSNLVFLIDVSGSMNDSAKLPLLVDAMKVLVEELDERDRVSMVVYAGAEGVVLNPTRITEEGRGQLLAALDKLRSGGSTNGGAGITRAYQLAQENFVEGGVNRVILATDGDFNVGTTGQGDLVRLVKERAQKGVFLSVLGFGSGNINDAMLEAITNDGNGNYFYIDSQKESRKVFLHDLSGTLVTIAKDVKIQVDFNPGKVAAYRLIGYANRILRDEDFNNDKIDAGDIGAGHTVTALYEIVPVGVALPAMGGVDASDYVLPDGNAQEALSLDWLTVKLRYKRPDGDKSMLLKVPVAEAPVAWEEAHGDFQFAAGVALFGMKLRQSEYANDAGWDLVRTLAKRGSARDLHGYRAEFLTLVDKAAGLEQRRVDPRPVEGIEAPPAE